MHEEEKARITANELRFIADSIPAMVSYVDRACRYCFVNAEYGRWLGRDIETIVGKTMEQVLGREMSESIRPYVDRALAGEKVIFESRLRRSAQKMHRIQITYTPDILNESGHVAGFVVHLVDLGVVEP